MAKNNVVGFEGHLPWDKTMPSDIKRYSSLIANHTIVMGANTFKEQDHARSKSRVVVLSRDKMELPNGVDSVHSVDEILALNTPENEVFVTGGGGVFHLLIEYADKLYLTIIDHEFQGDTFFPEINEGLWSLTSEEKFKKDDYNKYDYSFQTYERKR